MDKPVSLAERIAACCPSTFTDAAGMKVHPRGCTHRIHTLEAEAKALERAINRLGKCQRCGSTDRTLDLNLHCSTCYANSEARVEALEEVLREAPEPPNFAGLANLGVDPWTWVEHYREWYESRAAALAGEPRKETRDGD